MDKITLDREVFKALASDTRLDILKALDVRQKTVTELARELDLNKATVFEHLEKLAAVGLIQKIEDDRKWVYWQLSWTGRRLLHPEQIKLAILLSSAGGALVSGLMALWVWWRTFLPVPPGPPEAGRSAEPFAADAAEKSSPAPAGASMPYDESGLAEAMQRDPTWMWLAVAFAAVFVALVVAAWLVRRHAQAQRAGA